MGLIWIRRQAARITACPGQSGRRVKKAGHLQMPKRKWTWRRNTLPVPPTRSLSSGTVRDYTGEQGFLLPFKKSGGRSVRSVGVPAIDLSTALEPHTWMM